MLPAQDDKQQFVEHMFDRIAPRYDLLNRLMTFGIDRGWRRQLVAGLALRPDAIVLDLGCGTGDLVAEAARTGAMTVGVDISAGMLLRARARLPRAAFVRADAACLPMADATCDAAVSAFALRNFVSVSDVLHELGRVMRPGGRLGILEVDRPESSVLRYAFNVYFRGVVPMLGRALSRGYAYRYLSASLAYLPSGDDLTAMLAAAGFERVEKCRLTAGAAQIVFATRTSGDVG